MISVLEKIICLSKSKQRKWIQSKKMTEKHRKFQKRNRALKYSWSSHRKARVTGKQREHRQVLTIISVRVDDSAAAAQRQSSAEGGMNSKPEIQ